MCRIAAASGSTSTPSPPPHSDAISRQISRRTTPCVRSFGGISGGILASECGGGEGVEVLPEAGAILEVAAATAVGAFLLPTRVSIQFSAGVEFVCLRYVIGFPRKAINATALAYILFHFGIAAKNGVR